MAVSTFTRRQERIADKRKHKGNSHCTGGFGGEVRWVSWVYSVLFYTILFWRITGESETGCTHGVWVCGHYQYRHLRCMEGREWRQWSGVGKMLVGEEKTAWMDGWMDTWTVVVCSSIVLWACVYCCLSILCISLWRACVWPFHMLCGDG
jgi:hypothetical protein